MYCTWICLNTQMFSTPWLYGFFTLNLRASWVQIILKYLLQHHFSISLRTLVNSYSGCIGARDWAQCGNFSTFEKLPWWGLKGSQDLSGCGGGGEYWIAVDSIDYYWIVLDRILVCREERILESSWTIVTCHVCIKHCSAQRHRRQWTVKFLAGIEHSGARGAHLWEREWCFGREWCPPLGGSDALIYLDVSQCQFLRDPLLSTVVVGANL